MTNSYADNYVSGHNAGAHLAGDKNAREKIARMVRVNHAGEYGAVRIYAGQGAVLRKTEKAEIINKMADQERVHLATFEEIIRKKQVRPTALLPLWHVAGFALGAGTALLGEKAAMACTVAVEDAIDAHYAAQVEALDGTDEADLRDVCQRFREEEQEHRDIGLAHGAEQAPAYGLLYNAVHKGSKLAIWLSERI